MTDRPVRGSDATDFMRRPIGSVLDIKDIELVDLPTCRQN